MILAQPLKAPVHHRPSEHGRSTHEVGSTIVLYVSINAFCLFDNWSVFLPRQVGVIEWQFGHNALKLFLSLFLLFPSMWSNSSVILWFFHSDKPQSRQQHFCSRITLILFSSYDNSFVFDSKMRFSRASLALMLRTFPLSLHCFSHVFLSLIVRLEKYLFAARDCFLLVESWCCLELAHDLEQNVPGFSWLLWHLGHTFI